MAAVRPIVWKLLLIVLAMTAVETGLFLLRWEDCDHTNCFIDNIHVFPRIVYSLALTALTAVILRQGNWLAPGKPGYTMRRTPDKEGVSALIWMGIYFAAYLILRAAQIMIIFTIWKLFDGADPFLLVMEFYTDSFFHGLFPMENTVRHLRNLIWTLSVSATLSGAAYARRRGVNQIGPFILLSVELAFMGGGIELMGLEICLMGFIVLVAVFSVFNAWRANDETN
jgi:hypothetical protein